ncbi:MULTISPECIES: hypothetical protein [unclassified Roseovarius]|uniref:hypothetical protein n=1 Tax=unclassified Roseovarius TaxID=2614913 RepID=UPI00273D99BB|nr:MULTISPECIES: hypothetical protein [unclassified Roseovarius]
MPDALQDLANLTDAIYQAELQKMAVLNHKEAEIRRKIADLETLRRDNLQLPSNDLNAVRQIGADVLWQGWVGHTRESLNIELAQILAQKEYMKSALQRAFGKQAAAKELVADAAKQAHDEQDKRFWQMQDDLQAMRFNKDR